MRNYILFKYYGTLLITVLFFFLIIQNGSSQTIRPSKDAGEVRYPYVKWINEFPAKGKNSKTRGLFHRLGEVLFGSKNVLPARPVGVVAVDTSEFWIADQGKQTILSVVDRQCSKPRHMPAIYSSLAGICVTPAGNVLFTDSYQNKIYTYSTIRKELKDLNNSLKLEQPTGIAYSNLKHEIWVAETKSHCIAVLSEDGRLIRKFGKRGNQAGEFNYPTTIWIDRSGNIYIVDSMNFRIQVFDPQGKLISIFGKQGDASGYFARPKGLATDSYGNIYISDALFHTVQVFSPGGDLLYRFGSQGHEKEQFWMPSGLYIDKNDYIYVADTYNSRIQIFKLMTGNNEEKNSVH